MSLILVESMSTPIGGDHSKMTELSVISVILRLRGGLIPSGKNIEEYGVIDGNR